MSPLDAFPDQSDDLHVVRLDLSPNEASGLAPAPMQGLPDARPLVLGEVLFDCFPDGSRVLGGAPFNVAWHLQGFGVSPLFVSRIGSDDAGREVRAAMGAWGMDAAGLQLDSDYPTGRVEVSLDALGQPSFEILAQQAYDCIDARACARASAACEPALIYHGTLALRESLTRAALDALRERADLPVFIDVNLRAPWWQPHDLPPLLERARWVKINDDELARLGHGATQHRGEAIETRARAFRDTYELELLVVTRGAHGALALDAAGRCHTVAPGADTEVLDTVGAGDAFAAVILLGLLRDWPLPLTLDRAQDFASRICAIRGATKRDPQLYRQLTEAWKREPLR